MKQNIIMQIDESVAEGRKAIITTQNTMDRFIIGNNVPKDLGPTIFEAFQKRDYNIAYINLTNGYESVSSANNPNPFTNPCEPLTLTNQVEYLTPFFTHLIQNKEKSLVFIDNADKLLTSSQESCNQSPEERHLAGIIIELVLNERFKRNDNILILNCLDEHFIPEITKSGLFKNIGIGLPDTEDREKFISFLLKNLTGSNEVIEEIGKDELVRNSQGCRLKDIESTTRKSIFNGKQISNKDLIEKKKEAIYKITNGQLGIIEPDLSFDDIIGLDGPKNQFRYYADMLLTNPRAVPTIILNVGPSGTGKTMLSKALAQYTGFILIQLHNPRSKWVGESEERFKVGLNVVKSLDNCLVFCDELDLNFGSRNESPGDGGVDNRLLSQMLEFTGNNNPQESGVWIACSNNPASIDFALIDRSGAIIVYDLPSTQEKEQALQLEIIKQKRKCEKDINFKSLASHHNLKYASYRNIKDIVNQAGMYADFEHKNIGSEITQKNLLTAITELNLGNIEQINYVGKLSHSYKKFFNENLSHIPPYLEDCLTEDGTSVDREKLYKSLSKIEQLRRTA